MRIFNIVKAIMQKFNLITDYIIDEYNEGIWYVVKYNSGRLMAETLPTEFPPRAERVVTGTLMGSIMGGYYTRSSISYPESIKELTYWDGVGRLGTGGGYIAGLWIEGNKVVFDVVGNQNSASVRYLIKLYGRWK